MSRSQPLVQAPQAKAAMDKERAQGREKGVWDEAIVREWADVAAEAVREKREVHFGWLFAICGEKNSDLAEHDPLRK